MMAQDIFNSLEKSFGEKLKDKTEFRDETAYVIKESDLRDIAKFCRDQLSFDYLLDITSIDNFGEEPRFEIVYHLYSVPHGEHLRLKLKLSEEAGALDTVSDIWPTANWHEREIYDMRCNRISDTNTFGQRQDTLANILDGLCVFCLHGNKAIGDHCPK